MILKKYTKLLVLYYATKILLLFPSTAFSGASDTIMNTQNYNQSSHYLVPIRVRDASGGDNLQNGLPATAIYGFDGLGWDRITGDSTNGIDVDVTRMPANIDVSGSSTPADAFANPSDAINIWSLGALWNGSTWDRIRGDITNGVDVDVTRLPVVINSNTSNAGSNITTNVSTVTKASSGTINKIITNIAGTTSTVKIYDDASAPCDTNYLFTIDTSAIGVVNISHETANGICALTAGAVAADLTLLYR